MAIITRLIPHYTQPQQAVRVDRTLGFGSAVVNPATEAINAGLTKTVGKNGYYLKASSATGGKLLPAETFHGSGGTIVFIATAPSAVDYSFLYDGSSASNRNIFFRASSSSTGPNKYGWYINGTVIVDPDVSGGIDASLLDAVDTVVTLTWNSTTQQVYKNGVLFASFAVALSGSVTDSLTLLARYNNTFGWTAGGLNLLAFSNQRLDPRRISANPWQIFQPRKRQIYVSVASGGTTVAVPAGALTLTGHNPTVATSDHKTVSVPAGSLTLSGFAPTVSATSGTTIAVPAGSLTLTGYAPVVVNPHTISIPLATLSLTGYAPTVLAGVTVSVPAGSLALTGYAPTVINPVSIFIPAGGLTLTGFAPTVSNGAGITISVPKATLTLNGFAPAVSIESLWRTVSASGGVWVDASAASGTWTEV